MSSATTAPKKPEIAAKLFTALLWVIALPSIGYFLYVYAGRYTHFDPPHYFDSYYWPFRWWLVSHLSFSALALLLGPIQFVPVIRNRYRKVHRWVGRVYLIGVAGGIVTALYMVFFVGRNLPGGVSLFFLAVAWFVTSLMAYLTAIRRRFVEHREWMIRSYVVTFAFVTFRMMIPLPLFARFSAEAAGATRGWACWAVPLLITDMILGWQRMNSSRR